MYVLVVTLWAICLPVIREAKDQSAVRWFAVAALLSAAATAIVGVEAVARQPETEPAHARLLAQQVVAVLAVIGAFVAVGIGVPRALWLLGKVR